MTPEQFCYWMQGFVELSGGCPPTPEQWTSIGEHLQQVFNKKTPPVKLTRDVMPNVDPSQVPPFTKNGWPIDMKPSDIIC